MSNISKRIIGHASSAMTALLVVLAAIMLSGCDEKPAAKIDLANVKPCETSIDRICVKEADIRAVQEHLMNTAGIGLPMGDE